MSDNILNPDGTIDVIATLKAALPEAHQTSLSLAYLAGQLTQTKLEDLSNNPAMHSMAVAIDEVVGAFNVVEPHLGLLPEPYRTIFADVITAARVADKALVSLGL